MTPRGTQIRSGMFVLLALLVFSVLVFVVGNLKSRLQRFVEFHAYLPDARLLKSHDFVTYAGLRVGEVRDIAVSQERFGMVRVGISVRADIDVREDSVLALKQDGMLGARYVEIGTGSSDAARAQPGTVLKAVVPPAITDMTSALERPLAKMEGVLDHLQTILGDPENQKHISGVLADARDTFKGIQETLEQLRGELSRLSDVAATTAEKAQGLMEDTRGAIREIQPEVSALLKNAEELTGRLTKSADGLDALLGDADQVIVQNNKHIYEMIRAMRDTAYHMEQTTKRIRANPSVLLFGASETPEERMRTDETELRLRGRTRRYDKENVK